MKVYEKAVSRRHAPIFEPKATIAQLQDDDRAAEELDEHGRRRLVDEYLEVCSAAFHTTSTTCRKLIGLILTLSALLQFKQLMLKFDPEEEEDEEQTGQATSAAASEATPAAPPAPPPAT